MGFKEVMVLRQEGNLSDALKLAQKDYQDNQDQWSASALFWVLKDIATQQISEGKKTEAQIQLSQMEELVNHMGATTNVAQEALATLRKEVVPYYNEISTLAEEASSTKNRIRIKEIYATATEWLGGDAKQPDVILHEAYAMIMLCYLETYYQYIPYEEYQGVMERYFSLHNERPSKIHARFLKLAIEGKRIFGPLMDFIALLSKWNLANLQQKDWERGKAPVGEVAYSLGEEVLLTATTELMLKHEKPEVPQSVYQLLSDALIYFPEDQLVQLSHTRILLLEGDKQKALVNYEVLLQNIEEPIVWAEYAYLITEDDNLRMGALCMALREEKDDYREYINKARTELARLLIGKGLYELALRELTFVAQITLEKSYQLPEGHEELMKQIPEGTVQSKENKEQYYTLSRPALAHIYREIPEVLMMVYDVMAMRLRDQTNQVVPMLKLMTPEGKTALVTPKEAGILPGDNRGRIYKVKLLERHRKHTKVVLLTLCEDIDPKSIFPTKVGVINGYSEALNSYHVMDCDSRHHYLNGMPNEYIQGEFISFILLIEKQLRKGGAPASVREFIHHVERIDPKEGILHFAPLKAIVEGVRGDSYLLHTEQGTRSYVNQSVAPVELTAGDMVIVRGFQQRHKDRKTGQVSYSFNTLSIEPYFGN